MLSDYSWSFDKQVLIKKWGSGASVRIPAAVMAAASLNVGQTVKVHGGNGRIVIKAIGAPIYALEDLLIGMTPANFPDNERFCRPVGGEA